MNGSRRSNEKGLLKNREHAKRTRQRKRTMITAMENQMKSLKEEADKLQQLLIHSKTANILLGFSNHNQSISGDSSDNKSNDADDKVCEGEQSAADSDESTGRSHVSSSTSVYQSSTESLTKDSGDESRGITKKRKASEAGLIPRAPSSRTLKTLGISRCTSSLSISDYSFMKAYDEDKERANGEHEKNRERGGSPSGDLSIVDKLRGHVRAQVRESQQSHGEKVEYGYSSEPGSSTTTTSEQAVEAVKSDRSASSTVTAEYLNSREDVSDEEMPVSLKKERNRLHAKLTRDRKRLFTTKMGEVITFLEQENERRRQRLADLGVVAPDEHRVE